jgi:acyl-CoA synthetase (AMP-forming)/AMP-acid ligase II
VLKTQLSAMDPSQILWIEDEHLTTVAEALERSSTPVAPHLRGKKLAVIMRPSVRLLTALISIDGLCSEILLVPHDTPQNECDALLKQFGADACFHSETVALAGPVLAGNEGPQTDNDIQGTFATRWVIPTSGTTGAPKLVSHTFQSLTKTIKRPLTHPPLRWGLLYDISRFAGLQVFLSCLLSGSPLILTDEALPLDKRIAILERHDCDAISATPSMWRKILMTPSSQHLQLRQITLGGEIADQRVLNALRSRFPSSRIVHIYASTEAGVCFSVTDGLAGFPASYITDPPPDVELCVTKDNLLWVRPSNHDQRYISADKSLYERDGFINTGDLLRKSGDRYYFLGRANGSINVGGDKVLPEEVEMALLTIPYIRQARVYGKSNVFLGAVVAADVVVDPPKYSSEIILRELARLLPAHKVPATLNIVSDLELASTGKTIR